MITRNTSELTQEKSPSSVPSVLSERGIAQASLSTSVATTTTTSSTTSPGRHTHSRTPSSNRASPVRWCWRLFLTLLCLSGVGAAAVAVAAPLTLSPAGVVRLDAGRVVKGSGITPVYYLDRVEMLQCPLCGRVLHNRGRFRSHLEYCRRASNPQFTCQTCHKSFAYRKDLEKHERTHTGERPYTCHYCPFRFADRSSLVKHRRRHHPSPPPPP
ncbi:Zinc finger protein 394 [Portunus trituberculatus]|uniref:Zinc finger protein 394 n=1 Tax=Portunus trituberculatus TaxID=210409 RepID=A0A5B7DDT2_PORTR|nr:Zinc finger protein 394 [Portunus trituberculatus]